MSGVVFLVLRIGMAVALYCFLAWALITLWRTITQSARSATQSTVPRLTLAWSEGDSAQSCQLTSAEALVGRDPVCQVYLEDATISGRHARMFYDLAQWWLEDLASRNGTFMNGEPVTAAVVLATGDRLQFGQVAVLVTIDEPTSISAGQVQI